MCQSVSRPDVIMKHLYNWPCLSNFEPKRWIHFYSALSLYISVKRKVAPNRIGARVGFRSKYLYSNFCYFITRQRGSCHNIAKNAIHVAICVAVVPKCGAFCYVIQAISYPDCIRLCVLIVPLIRCVLLMTLRQNNKRTRQWPWWP